MPLNSHSLFEVQIAHIFHMIVPGMLLCSSFLNSECMFIVSKALLISNAIVIGRAGEPFCRTPLLLCCLMCVVPSLVCFVLYP